MSFGQALRQQKSRNETPKGARQTMPKYRLYCINGDGRFARIHEIDAANDAAAVSEAREKHLSVRCELWDRNRMVATLDPHRA
jgi:hypothetical protein